MAPHIEYSQLIADKQDVYLKIDRQRPELLSSKFMHVFGAVETEKAAATKTYGYVASSWHCM